MKRSHINTRKEAIKRTQRIFNTKGRWSATKAQNNQQAGKRANHRQLRQTRKAWVNLPDGIGPRPDRKPRFELKPRRMGKGYTRIGIRFAVVTKDGARRMGLTEGQPITIELIQTAWGTYSANNYYDLHGKRHGAVASTTFDFLADHPARHDVGLIIPTR